MARATPLKRSGGKLVSSKSKTGNPACSQAMSDWVRGRKTGSVASAVYAMLGKCRSQARQNKAATAKQASGKLAPGRGTWQRSEQAASLAKVRAGRNAARAAGKAPAKAEPRRIALRPVAPEVKRAARAVEHTINAREDANQARKHAPRKDLVDLADERARTMYQRAQGPLKDARRVLKPPAAKSAPAAAAAKPARAEKPWDWRPTPKPAPKPRATPAPAPPAPAAARSPKGHGTVERHDRILAKIQAARQKNYPGREEAHGPLKAAFEAERAARGPKARAAAIARTEEVAKASQAHPATIRSNQLEDRRHRVMLALGGNLRSGPAPAKAGETKSPAKPHRPLPDVVGKPDVIPSRPAASKPAATPAGPKEIASVVDRLRTGPYAGKELIPIHEVRRLVAEHHGADAASHANLDPILRQMRGEGKVRMIAIADNRDATQKQLDDALPGMNENIFYISTRRPNDFGHGPSPAPTKAVAAPAGPKDQRHQARQVRVLKRIDARAKAAAPGPEADRLAAMRKRVVLTPDNRLRRGAAPPRPAAAARAKTPDGARPSSVKAHSDEIRDLKQRSVSMAAADVRRQVEERFRVLSVEESKALQREFLGSVVSPTKTGGARAILRHIHDHRESRRRVAGILAGR